MAGGIFQHTTFRLVYIHVKNANKNWKNKKKVYEKIHNHWKPNALLQHIGKTPFFFFWLIFSQLLKVFSFSFSILCGTGYFYTIEWLCVQIGLGLRYTNFIFANQFNFKIWKWSKYLKKKLEAIRKRKRDSSKVWF